MDKAQRLLIPYPTIVETKNSCLVEDSWGNLISRRESLQNVFSVRLLCSVLNDMKWIVHASYRRRRYSKFGQLVFPIEILRGRCFCMYRVARNLIFEVVVLVEEKQMYQSRLVLQKSNSSLLWENSIIWVGYFHYKYYDNKQICFSLISFWIIEYIYDNLVSHSIWFCCYLEIKTKRFHVISNQSLLHSKTDLNIIIPKEWVKWTPSSAKILQDPWIIGVLLAF